MNSPFLQQLVFEQATEPATPKRVNQLTNWRLGKDATQKELPAYSKKTIAVVLLVHLLIIVQLMRQVHLTPEPQAILEPITVSLITTPQPEMRNIPNSTNRALEITPAEPKLKPVEKTQKTNQAKIEPIKTIETPAEQVAPTHLKATQNETNQEVAPAQPAQTEVTPAASKSVMASDAQKPEAANEAVIEPPRFGVAYLNNPAPDYPALSRRSGEEGRVLMKVLVSTEGTAETVQIEKSSGSERLDLAAIDAVKRWRFIPAQKNKQPISAFVLVPIKFALNS